LVIGGYRTHIKFLINNHKVIKEKLYQEEFSDTIETILYWFESILRTSSMKLIKYIVGPQAFGEKYPSD
jgi:hypothetical protein